MNEGHIYEKLGTIDGKLDSLIKQFSEHVSQQEGVEKRIRKLETNQTKLGTLVGIVAAAIAFTGREIISFFFKK